MDQIKVLHQTNCDPGWLPFTCREHSGARSGHSGNTRIYSSSTWSRKEASHRRHRGDAVASVSWSAPNFTPDPTWDRHIQLLPPGELKDPTVTKVELQRLTDWLTDIQPKQCSMMADRCSKWWLLNRDIYKTAFTDTTGRHCSLEGGRTKWLWKIITHLQQRCSLLHTHKHTRARDMISQEKFAILRVLCCVNLLCPKLFVSLLLSAGLWRKCVCLCVSHWTNLKENQCEQKLSLISICRSVSVSLPCSCRHNVDRRWILSLWDVTEIVLALKETWPDVSSVYVNLSFERQRDAEGSLQPHWAWMNMEMPRVWEQSSTNPSTQTGGQQQPQPDNSHPSVNGRNRCSVQLLWLKYAGFIFGHRHHSSSRFLHLLLSFSLSFICSLIRQVKHNQPIKDTQVLIWGGHHTNRVVHVSALELIFKRYIKFSFKSHYLSSRINN